MRRPRTRPVLLILLLLAGISGSAQYAVTRMLTEPVYTNLSFGESFHVSDPEGNVYAIFHAGGNPYYPTSILLVMYNTDGERVRMVRITFDRTVAIRDGIWYNGRMLLVGHADLESGSGFPEQGLTVLAFDPKTDDIHAREFELPGSIEMVYNILRGNGQDRLYIDGYIDIAASSSNPSRYFVAELSADLQLQTLKTYFNGYSYGSFALDADNNKLFWNTYRRGKVTANATIQVDSAKTNDKETPYLLIPFQNGWLHATVRHGNGSGVRLYYLDQNFASPQPVLETDGLFQSIKSLPDNSVLISSRTASRDIALFQLDQDLKVSRANVLNPGEDQFFGDVSPLCGGKMLVTAIGSQSGFITELITTPAFESYCFDRTAVWSQEFPVEPVSVPIQNHHFAIQDHAFTEKMLGTTLSGISPAAILLCDTCRFFRFPENNVESCTAPYNLMPEYTLDNCIPDAYTFTWTWTEPDSVETRQTGNTDLTINTSGSYALTVSDGRCTQRDSFHALLDTHRLRITGDTLVCEQTGTVATLTARGAMQNIFWPGSGDTLPVQTVTKPGLYRVTALSAELACEREALAEIHQYCPPSLYVPNAFTPNGDQLNDTFLPVVSDVTTYRCSVFNAWGEEVFHSETLGESWNGHYKNRECPEGIYVWRIEWAGRYKGRIYQEERTGHITLLR